jgi:hypothetical protein
LKKMITYRDYMIGSAPNLKRAQKNGEVDTSLVMGWATYPGDETEILWASLADGTYMTTDIIRRSDDFNRKDRKWFSCDAIPDSAEWIGHYPDNLPRKQG